MRRRRDPPTATLNRAPTLLVTGSLMILAVFALANPWLGARSEDWPWKAFFGQDVAQQSGGLRTMATTGLWLLTALWAVLLALRGPIRLRALGLCTFTALLTLVCAQGGGPFPLEGMELTALLPVVLLGSGLWLARSRWTRGTGQFLAGAGGLLIAWVLSSGSAGRPLVHLGSYQILLQDLHQNWQSGAAPPVLFWHSFLPQSLVLLCAAFGLLVALGISMRRTTTVFFFLLLAGVWMPGIARAFSGVGPDGSIVESGSLATLLGTLGLADSLLWLLSVFAVADLVRSRPGQDELEFGL